MTYEEALQIAMEELDDKIEHLSETFKGYSSRVESYIYSLSMARKALIKALEDAEKKFEFKNGPINFMPLEETPENFERSHQKEREWVGLTEDEAFACKGQSYFETYKNIDSKLKEKNA